MKSTKFDFLNSKGELLSGRLELPDSPAAFAIFAHCFTCSKNVKAATRISRQLADNRIAVLRFDFTGLGNSEGDFSNTNYSSNLADIEFAANALTEKYESPAMLIGHSLGGTACLYAAGKIDSVRAVCTIGSPAQPEHVTKLFGDSLAEIESQGSIQVELAGSGVHHRTTVRRRCTRSTFNRQEMNSLGRAALIFHSPQDELVSVDQARLIYQSLKHPKSFVALDAADHMLTNELDASYVANVITAWIGRYIADKLNEGKVRKPDALNVGEVLVSQTNGFTNSVQTADHLIVADEPIAVGGANAGMTPYDLLLASLGACTSMTLKIYAEHKKLPLEHVEVRLRHQKIHVEDCAACESEKGRVDQISKEITVKGDLTPEQVKRLGEIADRCPVNRTLVGEKEIVTSIKLA